MYGRVLGKLSKYSKHLYLTCAVVLMEAPALRSTLTTLGWPLWDAAIRAVIPSCDGDGKNYQCDAKKKIPAILFYYL